MFWSKTNGVRLSEECPPSPSPRKKTPKRNMQNKTDCRWAVPRRMRPAFWILEENEKPSQRQSSRNALEWACSSKATGVYLRKINKPVLRSQDKNKWRMYSHFFKCTKPFGTLSLDNCSLVIFIPCTPSTWTYQLLHVVSWLRPEIETSCQFHPQ